MVGLPELGPGAPISYVIDDPLQFQTPVEPSGETNRPVGELCIECGQPFRVGERVQHVPGSTARHADCPDEYERFDPF